MALSKAIKGYFKMFDYKNGSFKTIAQILRNITSLIGTHYLSDSSNNKNCKYYTMHMSHMVQLLFICRNSDPKKFAFFTTRPVLLCKNETDKYFSMNSSGFY